VSDDLQALCESRWKARRAPKHRHGQGAAMARSGSSESIDGESESSGEDDGGSESSEEDDDWQQRRRRRRQRGTVTAAVAQRPPAHSHLPAQQRGAQTQLRIAQETQQPHRARPEPPFTPSPQRRAKSPPVGRGSHRHSEASWQAALFSADIVVTVGSFAGAGRWAALGQVSRPPLITHHSPLLAINCTLANQPMTLPAAAGLAGLVPRLLGRGLVERCIQVSAVR
jgi:hypothetical protein